MSSRWLYGCDDTTALSMQREIAVTPISEISPVYYLNTTIDTDRDLGPSMQKIHLNSEECKFVSRHVDLKHAMLRQLSDARDHYIETGESIEMTILVLERGKIRAMNEDEGKRAMEIIRKAKSSRYFNV